MQKLSLYRKEIDKIDTQILGLLSKRGKIAKEIAQLKKNGGKAIHVPSREKYIFDRIVRLNRGPYKSESLISIFREVISATRSLEAPLHVSYLGPEATFTHMAAEKYFGSSTHLLPASDIKMIFEEVEKGHSDYGVVPIENSTEGVVNHTLDMFVDSALQISAEIVLKVSHHVLCQENLPLKSIKTVYSHPHALAQCRSWLSQHLPKTTLRETESTAVATQKAKTDKFSVAIASEIAANVYQMTLLARNIQDNLRNYTRFLVIGDEDSGVVTKKDKTSMLFAIKDEAGGLYKILTPLSKAKINLTKIESRPQKKRAWEYMFFVDLDGHYKEPHIHRALRSVEKQCSFFRILGAYPKSRDYE